MKKIILIATIIINAFFVNAQNSISESDKKFAVEAAEGSLMEVKLGELAQANAASPQVKELGSHMINDHTKANDELKSLANTKGIVLPATMSKKGQKMYDKLSKKQGAEFDKAYTKCMVKDHKKDIDEFKKEEKNVNDPELKAWVAKTIPTLEQYKQMSETACKAVHDQK